MGIFTQRSKINLLRKLRIKSNCDIVISRKLSKQSTAKLSEVGQFEPPKLESKYEIGQLFLHRIFGYRGVILFPWVARVYDRDLHNPSRHPTILTSKPKAISTETIKTKDKSKSDRSEEGAEKNTSGKLKTSATGSGSSTESTNKEVKGKVQTFYQVLIDARDCPFIRAQTEAVTFLGSQESNRSLYAIPGLDYVGHDDIMPYSSTERHPLNHELFEKFLKHSPGKQPPFVAHDTLLAWQEKNHPWLELSDVHKETTENIRVTVIPFYMGCRETPSASVYWWRYCIRLENLGQLSVQLRERHWRIFSLSGTLETVRGRGVVGQEPILSTRLPAFQYSSHVSLQAPSGHMWGTFRLEREDGHTFDCKIPPFSLESKPDEVPSTAEKTSAGTNTTPSSSHKKDNDDDD